jgi:hypothetical protein
VADDLALLYSSDLVAGQTARAAHVVANFNQIITRVNTHDGQITTLEAESDSFDSSITDLQGRVTVNEGEIDVLQSDVADLETATVQMDVFKQDTNGAWTPSTLQWAPVVAYRIVEFVGTAAQSLTLPDPTQFDEGYDWVFVCNNSFYVTITTGSGDFLTGETWSRTILDGESLRIGIVANAAGVNKWAVLGGERRGDYQLDISAVGWSPTVSQLYSYNDHRVINLKRAIDDLQTVTLPDPATIPFGRSWYFVCQSTGGACIKSDNADPPFDDGLILNYGEVAKVGVMTSVAAGGGTYKWIVLSVMRDYLQPRSSGSYRTISSNTQLNIYDKMVIGDCDGGSRQLTLPDVGASSAYVGHEIIVVASGDSGSNTVQVITGSGAVLSRAITLDEGEAAKFTLLPQVTVAAGSRYVWLVTGGPDD